MAPPRRTARTPPARSRTTATAMPTLRLLDIAVLRSDRRRGAGRRHIGHRGHRGHGAEATDLQVHATVELLHPLARSAPRGALGARAQPLTPRFGPPRLTMHSLTVSGARRPGPLV